MDRREKTDGDRRPGADTDEDHRPFTGTAMATMAMAMEMSMAMGRRLEDSGDGDESTKYVTEE